MENAESQTVNVKTSTPKKFRWDNKMIEKLIDSLKEYKDTMLITTWISIQIELLSINNFES